MLALSPAAVTHILPQLKSKQRAVREIKSQLMRSLGETITEIAWAYLNDTKGFVGLEASHSVISSLKDLQEKLGTGVSTQDSHAQDSSELNKWDTCIEEIAKRVQEEIAKKLIDLAGAVEGSDEAKERDDLKNYLSDCVVILDEQEQTNHSGVDIDADSEHAAAAGAGIASDCVCVHNGSGLLY